MVCLVYLYFYSEKRFKTNKTATTKKMTMIKQKDDNNKTKRSK